MTNAAAPAAIVKADTVADPTPVSGSGAEMKDAAAAAGDDTSLADPTEDSLRAEYLRQMAEVQACWCILLGALLMLSLLNRGGGSLRNAVQLHVAKQCCPSLQLPSHRSLSHAYHCLQVYDTTKEEWKRREPFESSIKRPYFHVKPIDNAQLINWSRWALQAASGWAPVCLCQRSC